MRNIELFDIPTMLVVNFYSKPCTINRGGALTKFHCPKESIKLKF